VVFIHGFNDAYPDAYYFSLRREINEHLTNQPTYIEVYWDGLNAMGSNPAIAGIWQKARLNSAKVGLGLRNTLKDINKDANLTVITHSLGASVATHFLFNPNVWPKKFQEKLETDYQSSDIPTPACKSISLGLLAPAISGTTIFDDVLNTVPISNESNLKKIILGYNHFDYAVTKGGLFPKAFGNTSLGADADFEVNKTIAIINKKIPSAICKGIDFSYTSSKAMIDTLSKKEKKKLKQSEHAILFYQQNIHFKTFLNSLFPQ
jgi:Alpha/beta hydrolase of unknown function (DUF900)